LLDQAHQMDPRKRLGEDQLAAQKLGLHACMFSCWAFSIVILISINSFKDFNRFIQGFQSIHSRISQESSIWV
jgi:hypothetical protein